VSRTYYVSAWFKEQLIQQWSNPWMRQALQGPIVNEVLLGLPIVVSSYLPYKTGKIIQKDPFVTYEPRDMIWAERVGLAQWELCHAVCAESPPAYFDRPDHVTKPEK